MKRKLHLVVGTILVLGLGGSLGYSFGKKSMEKSFQPQTTEHAATQGDIQSDQSLQAPQTSQEGQGIPVKVAPVKQEDIHITQTFYGTAVPYAEANVQGKHGGEIVLLKGKEGDFVNKGDVIVEFDDSDLQLEIQQMVTVKNTALQNVNQAQSNFETIRTNATRYEELLKEGFVPKQQVDEVNNQLQSAQAALNTSLEAVKQTEAQIRLLQNKLQDLRITAPIGGIIDEKHYNLHEIYSAGEIIFHLIDIDRVYIEVEIPESYISQIQENMTLQVFFDSLQDQEFSGNIERIVPKGDRQNRNFLAKALVKNPNHVVKPGMFSRVNIEIENIPDALVIPKKLWSREGENYYVFKVVDLTVQKIPVVVRYDEGASTAIFSDDLQAEDQVVIEGTHLLKPDARVKVL
jgi:RND family efflux transporter MFP subunit